MPDQDTNCSNRPRYAVVDRATNNILAEYDQRVDAERFFVSLVTMDPDRARHVEISRAKYLYSKESQ